MSPTIKLTHSHLLCFGFQLLFTAVIYALPTELDPFLELLFDIPQCDDFLGDAQFLSVATIDCKPFKCDFPRQLCMRPANKLLDESANQCRGVPEKCLTAANGGVSLHFLENNETSTLFPTLAPSLTTESLKPVTIPQEFTSLSKLGTNDEICKMEQPQGRFCGFQIKFAYNRDNKRCEQFWFPGCKTEETNANLFDTEDDCFKATYFCYESGTITGTTLNTPLPAFHSTSDTTMLPFHFTSSNPMPPFHFTSATPMPVFRFTPATRGRPFLSVKPSPEMPFGIISTPFNLRNLIGGNVKPPYTGGTDFNNKPYEKPTKGTLLGLITDGISQFTNSGGPDTDSETSGNFLENFNLDKIPQLIKTLQAA